jgi:hypothetical protein
MPYAVPFLALDDLLRIKTTGVHDVMTACLIGRQHK